MEGVGLSKMGNWSKKEGQKKEELTFVPHTHFRLERDELSDDELCEAAEVDIEDDDDDDNDKGAVGGARARAYTCAESGLKPSARMRLYDNQEWRLEVSYSSWNIRSQVCSGHNLPLKLSLLALERAVCVGSYSEMEQDRH